jgi:hypothetical protein
MTMGLMIFFMTLVEILFQYLEKKNYIAWLIISLNVASEKTHNIVRCGALNIVETQ